MCSSEFVCLSIRLSVHVQWHVIAGGCDLPLLQVSNNDVLAARLASAIVVAMNIGNRRILVTCVIIN